MATKLINRSNATMDVLVDTSGGVEQIIRVEPGQQNNATVTPKAVTPTSGLDRLMGGNDWLEILTDTAIIYHFGSSGLGLSSFATLHCVPFMPAGTGPFTSGYRVVAAPAAPGHPNPQPVEDALPADDKDGEFSMPGQLLFGKYVRTKIGTTTYISVRLNLRRMGVTAGQLIAIKPIWKAEIEKDVWNNSPPSSTGQSYRFEADWTNRNSHSSVFVFDKVERASMFHWSLTMAPPPLNAPVAAHEFGHHLGLSDGYHYQGEIPSLTDAMTKSSARYRGKTITPTAETLTMYAFGLNRVTTRRAKERITNGSLPHSGNLMTGSSRVGPRASRTHPSVFTLDADRDGVSAVPTIDVELIDAIENQTLQPLYLDEVDFLSNESYSDPGFSYDGYFSA